ncbi:dihydrodipicolinate synthase family protein [Chloroflexota bacterium]
MRVKAREAKEWARTLRGIFDNFPTPYTEEGGIDEATLRELVRYHFEHMNSDGLIGFGAEFLFFTKEERKRHAEIIVDEAARVRPGAPVIVQPLCVSVEETVELTRHAAEVGAAAVMIRNPVLATDENGIYDFYKYVADNTDIPIVIMNIQGVGGAFTMSPQFIARMAREMPAVCAIKNPAGANHCIALKRLAGDDMVVPCLDSYALMSGVINPLGLVDAVSIGRASVLFQTPGDLILRDFVLSCAEGRLAHAAELFFGRLNHLFKLYYEVVMRPTLGGGMGYSQVLVKYWASLLGVPVGSPIAKPPVSATTNELKEKIRSGLTSAGLISS